MSILTQSTTSTLWWQIVHDAEGSCALSLPAELESYLVFLLTKYIDQTHFMDVPIAKQFLTGLNSPLQMRTTVLQDVGDQCLLISGLYPNIAKKRHVTVRYFVHLGKSAYLFISQSKNDLYAHLGEQFIALMDVLLSIRPNTLLPLDAYELWQQTGSRRAFTMLQKLSKALPVFRK